MAQGAVAEAFNNVTNDIVIEQDEITYNEAGQTIINSKQQRFHDATGTGPLQGPNGDQPKGRRTFTAQWYDPIGRSIASADYGTNGGSEITRPDAVPDRSDIVLVSSTRYAASGETNASIDPMGIMTRWEDDKLGRRMRLIEAAVEDNCACKRDDLNSCNDGERITKYSYTADGQMETLTLVNDETGNQVTRWVYGTTLEDSKIARNDLLRAKIYPESDNDYAPLGNGPYDVYNRIEYAYNRSSQVTSLQDPNETVHELDFDKLGRTTQDRVTTFGNGVEDTVKRIATAYDSRGLTATVTSYDDAEVGSGNVVNEVEYQYDDFGQMIEDIQSHSGAVTGTTPKVAYQYADGSSENTIRRTSMTYPDGRKVLWQYGAAGSIDQTLSRIKSLKVEGETSDLLTYTHVGAARYVTIAYPEPSLELSYIKAATDPMRDSGDPYTGYDRFGRTVDMKWQNDDGSEMKDRIQYGYNQSGNRTWRKNLVAPENQDEHYGYDELYQVTDFARGNINLNQTTIGGIPTYEQSFEYDPAGNWDKYKTSENGSETLNQTRSHNQDNQISQIDGSNVGILYDRTGNALQMPPNKNADWETYYQLTWDAWNRLVTIKDEVEAVVASYEYDGTTRRTLKTVGGAMTHFYYNNLWKCVEERIGSAILPQQQYLWGARTNHKDELIRRDRDNGGGLNERLFCLMDYYNPLSMTDQSGSVVERYHFSAFGLRQITDANWTPRSTSSFDVTFAFHGEFRDPESGYENYGFRYYDPEAGRWSSRDPIGEQGGMNLYGFVGNNGIGKVDLFGSLPNNPKFETEFQAFASARSAAVRATDFSVMLGEGEIASIPTPVTWKIDPITGISTVRIDGTYSLFLGEKSVQSGENFISYSVLTGLEHFSIIYCIRSEYYHTRIKEGRLPDVKQFLHERIYGTIPITAVLNEIRDIKNGRGTPLALVHSHNVSAYTQNSATRFLKFSLIAEPKHNLSRDDENAATALKIPVCAVTDSGISCTSIR